MVEPEQQQQYIPGYTGVSPFYRDLGRLILHGESEKSFIDKLLGRQDADKLHDLIKKEPLTLSDIEEILFLMTSIDQKLLNYNEWDRYIIVKLFPWIKDFSIICKTFMIYEQSYENGDFNKDFKISPLNVQIPADEDNKIIVLTPEEQRNKKEVFTIIKEINKYLLHDFKFLISTFLLLSNTTLSINGAAFDSMITSKFEYSYPSPQLPPSPEKKSIFNIFRGKK